VTDRNKDVQPDLGGFTRRSMIAGSAGAATTIAVTALAPGAAAAASRSEAAPIAVPKPTTPVDQDPVVAYIHDAARGEVTVIHGEGERTYRDPALVRRLLAAANASKETR
jgi:hypothetical protein